MLHASRARPCYGLVAVARSDAKEAKTHTLGVDGNTPLAPTVHDRLCPQRNIVEAGTPTVEARCAVRPLCHRHVGVKGAPLDICTGDRLRRSSSDPPARSIITSSSMPMACVDVIGGHTRTVC
eukprot:4157004-Prymnesium_polylepis.2